MILLSLCLQDVIDSNLLHVSNWCRQSSAQEFVLICHAG